jgi:hypothetical protein
VWNILIPVYHWVKVFCPIRDPWVEHLAHIHTLISRVPIAISNIGRLASTWLVTVSGVSWPWESRVQCVRKPKVRNGRLGCRRKQISNCSVRCTQTGKADYFPYEEPTTPRLLEDIKGPLGVMEQHPDNTLKQSQEHITNSETPITLWFIRERFECFLSWDSVSFHSCALFFTCVRGLAAFVLLCVLLLHPLLLFLIVIILCKVWETSTCVDSLQTRIYYKEDNRGIQVWSLDLMRGVACNLRPLRHQNMEVGLRPNTWFCSTFSHCDFVLPSFPLHFQYCSSFNTQLVRANKQKNPPSILNWTWF